MTRLVRLSKKDKELSCLSVPDGPQLSFSSCNGHSSRRDPHDACHACTTTELPRFHSISCEQDHPVFWEANAGSSLCPPPKPSYKKPSRKRICKRWIFEQSCVYMDGSLAVLVTCLRTGSDAIHLSHIWLQFKLAYVSKESLVIGRGTLEWDARKIACHYLRLGGGFWFDLFVILPILQVVLWVVVPYMIRAGHTRSVMTIMLILFLFQYIPKIYHVLCLARRIQHVNGFVFGTVWWGFALNLSAYMIAAHTAGSCWYLLASQQVATCLAKQCQNMNGCHLKLLGCSQPVSYGGEIVNTPWYGYNQTDFSICFNGQSYVYGIYQWAIPLVTEQNWSTKFLYPIFWGIMTMSSFGNALVPSNHTLEAAFCIVVITFGLLLFTLLIGNIQVFLHSISSQKEAMKHRLRDLEWWMRRRQLPAQLRHRVRRYQWHHWAATHGIDEEDIVHGLPEGLRRDIKRNLCLDLVRQVPLFEQMDNLVLDNICDRLKPRLFIKGDTVIKEGDPVQRMLFVVRGHLHSSHQLSNGQTSTCYLGPGNFCGDELLSWCLRIPFLERIPPSSATLTSLDSTEAFGLEAQDLKYVTEHFRYKFVNGKLKRTIRYYSSGWRTWAAVTIQLAWKRYNARKANLPMVISPDLHTADNIEPRISPLALSQSENGRLRFYAAMFTSPKPQDHLGGGSTF